MNRAYINRKISKCKKLVETATSEAQKKIYQGYLDHWTKKLPAKERPEEIAKKEEAKQKKVEITLAKAKAAELATLKAEEEIQRKIAEIKAEKIAAKKAELAALEADDFLSTDLDNDPNSIFFQINKENAEEFEKLYPGKKAYRYQNGDKIKTIAFKEYLNQRTQ